MNEADDVQLKAEIDSIMERVNRIMQDIDGLGTETKDAAGKAEE